MWKTAICALLILIVAIVALAVNILIVQDGSTPSNVPDPLSATATVHFRYSDIWMKLSSDVYRSGNKTKTVSYDEAYDDQCQDDDTDTSYCNSLDAIRKAGTAYMVLSVAGCVLCLVAFIICVLEWFGRFAWHHRNVHTRYVVAVIIFAAVICFLVAWAVFWGEYRDNLDNILNGLVEAYFPLLKTIDWDDAYIGASTDLLIVCNALGLAALVVAVMLERPKPGTHFGYEQQTDYHTTA